MGSRAQPQQSAPLHSPAAAAAGPGHDTADARPRANGVPPLRSPLRLTEPSRSAAGDQRLRDLRDELERLDRAYRHALRCARDIHDPDAIAAAFDESDALQRRVLSGQHRRRQLEDELAHAAASDEVHQPPLGAAAHRTATAPRDRAA